MAVSTFVNDNDSFCDLVQLTATQKKGGVGGGGDNNSSSSGKKKDECGHYQIFQGVMMQRLCCEKVAITNRDKKYNENTCHVWK